MQSDEEKFQTLEAFYGELLLIWGVGLLILIAVAVIVHYAA